MAEVFLSHFGGEGFEVESAGLELASGINPLVIAVMKEIGFDLEGKGMQRVMDLFIAGKAYDYIIAVCDAAKASKCPVFPGGGTSLHWPFEDPAALEGDWESRLARTRQIRDRIKDHVCAWLEEIRKTGISRHSN